MSEPDIAAAIERQGFFIANFESDGYLPAFSYTIGLKETCDQPELLTMGLSLDLNAGNLVRACELVKSGQEMTTVADYDNFLEGYLVRFLPILKEHMPHYFGFGMEYYNYEDFPAMQLVWPSKSHHWPWDEACDENVRFLQKLLDRDPHFSFFEMKNTGVLVSRGIFESDKPILDVFHDEDDGSWQFLSDEPRDETHAMMVCLEEIVKRDPTVNQLFDLGYGESAHRKSPDEEWTRERSHTCED